MKQNKFLITIVILLIIFFALNHVQSTTGQDDPEKVYIVATLDVTVHHDTKEVYTGEIQNDEIMEELPKPKVQPVETPEIKQDQPSDQRIIKKGWAEDHEIQDLVNYAYKIGGKDFLLTLEGENGLWKWDRKSTLVGANGYSDYGLCQLNGQYHRQFLFANGYNLKAGWSKDFMDPYKQLDYCWGVFQDGVRKGRITTTFYAYNVRHEKAVRFENLP